MTARMLLSAALVLLVYPAPGARAAETWAVPEADARVGLSLQGDLYARERVTLEAMIDFNDLLGAHRCLAADSLVLVHAASGDRVPLDLAEDAEIRYASGNPIVRLRWSWGPLEPFEERAWHLYLHTVPPGDAASWQHLEGTFLPAAGEALFATSFEQPDPDRPQNPVRFLPGGKDQPGERTERVWTDADARTGQRCLRIARTFEGDPPTNTNRPFWWTWPPCIEVREGQSVGVSAWVKAVRLEPGAIASVMLEFRDEEKGRLQEGRLLLRGDRVPHDWKHLTGSTTAPREAASAVVWFSLHLAGEAFCDDVTVAAGPGGSLPGLPVTVGPLEERSAFAAASEQPAPEKLLTCTVAGAPPALDGSLDDPCWQGAGRVQDFIPFLQIPGTQVTTTVLACADQQALYFGFECAEPSTESLAANATERDGRLWEDDSVELFLDTNLDRRTYYQIIVNSQGVIFDQDTGAPGLAGPKWDGPVQAAAKVVPDRWTAEVRLEFTGLRLAEAGGQRWGLNFARTSLRGGRSCYSWARVNKGFGEPANFGSLLLPFDPSASAVTGRPLAGERVFWGQGVLPFEVSNRRDEAVRVRLVVSQEADDAAEALGETTLSVKPRSTAEAGVDCSFTGAGEVRLRYDLFEQPAGRLLYTTSLTHTVPEPLEVSPSSLVSYLDEQRLRGRWTLGLAETALADSSLVFSLVPEGGDTAMATETIVPRATAGSFAIEVKDLRPGAYDLRVDLMRADQPLGSTALRFHRIPGPFSPRG